MPDFVSIRTVLHGVEVPALRPGVPSFLGVPLATTAADLAAADVAIIGVPQGAAASPGRDPGEWSDCGRGPENARRQSMRYTGYLPELDIDVFDSLKVVDCGDAEIPEDDQEAGIANTAGMVERAVRAGCAVIAIGGAVPTANYAVARGAALATDGTVGTVGLDAHGDAFDSLGGPAGNTKPGPGTWQRRLWEHSQNVDPAHQVEFGMRGPRNDRQVFDTYREKGVSVYTARKMREMGASAAVAEAIPRATEGVARTWISLGRARYRRPPRLGRRAPGPQRARRGRGGARGGARRGGRPGHAVRGPRFARRRAPGRLYRGLHDGRPGRGWTQAEEEIGRR